MFELREYIYCIECMANGRKYIGRSKNVDSRVADHFARLKRGAHHVPLFQEDFNKYGEDAFMAQILETYSDSRGTHERDWQLLLKTYDAEHGYNYNDKYFTSLEGQTLIKEREEGKLAVTIAATDREIKGIIEKHHVYGAEVVINALTRASIEESYLDENTIIQMVHNAFKRELAERQPN